MCDTTADTKDFFLTAEKDTSRMALVWNSLSLVPSKRHPHTRRYFISEPGKINLEFLFY